MTAWKRRSPLDPLAYGFGILMLIVFLLVQGAIVGALVGTALATGGALINLRVLYAVWVSTTGRRPER